MVQFAVLEVAIRFFQNTRKRKVLNGAENAFIGAFTGAVTSLATEPLDVVRTRLMTQRSLGVEKLRASAKTVYHGWLHCFQTMAREEGPLALYKGSLLRILWVGLGSALWYSTFEATKKTIATKKASNISSKHSKSPAEAVQENTRK